MPAPTDPRATAVMRAALAVLVVALLALTAWQYLVPLGFEANWGLNPDAVTRFREAYGVRVPRLGAVGYRRGFHVLHVLAGTAYLALVGAGLAGGRLSRRTVLTTTIGLAVGLALVWPLSFSLDTYRYVGYARLVAVYHLNPYAANRQALLDLHDMTAKFMVYDLPSPYGPLWMWLSIAVVWVTKGMTLLAQVIALKLLAAAALVGLGRAGRALAERLEAGRGELALVAIGCNPWFLIEGPGNGHNDLVMMALVMVALVALFDGRHRVSALLVGCAAGVKFLPLMLVPWLMVSAAREAAPDRRRMAAAVATIVAVSLVPLVVAYAPLWRGIATLGGIGHHWQSAQSGPASTSSLAGLFGLGAYVWGSWYVRSRGGTVAAMVTAWAFVSLIVMLTAAGTWFFPWYLAWPWSVLLTRWDRAHTALSAAMLMLAIAISAMYAIWSN